MFLFLQYKCWPLFHLRTIELVFSPGRKHGYDVIDHLKVIMLRKVQF